MQDNHMHSKLFCQLSQYENLFICVNTTLLSNHWNCSIFFNREQISFSCKYLRSLSAHIRILPMNREARWLSVPYMEVKVLRSYCTEPKAYQEIILLEKWTVSMDICHPSSAPRASVAQLVWASLYDHHSKDPGLNRGWILCFCDV